MPLLQYWHCSVCSGNYSNKRRWLRHLLKDKHQKFARTRLPNWEDKERSCVLTLFAKLPVGRDDKIIQYLSTDFGTVVTDLVWWEERPRIVFVRFESRDKANAIVASLKNNQFHIHPNQICNVRSAETIPELEWKELFPLQSVTSTSPPPLISQIIEIPESPVQHHRDPNSTNVPPKKVKLEDPEEDSVHLEETPSSPDESRQLSSLAPISSYGAKNSSRKEVGLRHHLDSIQKLVGIPAQEQDIAVDIIHKLQEALNFYGRSQNSLYKADISRQWVLYSLLDHHENISCSIWIHKYPLKKKKRHSKSNSNMEIKREELRKIKKVLTIQKEKIEYFLSYEATSITQTQDPGSYGIVNYVITTKQASNAFHLSIETNPGHLVTLQAWRLFEYLCTFDPHCRPVVSIAYYWARTNDISIGTKKASPPFVLPDPSGLNWLLILFFQKEGLIPSTQSILEQPQHAPPILRNDINIGFSQNTEFEDSWRNKRNAGGDSSSAEDSDEFAGEVFTLLHKFFQFCTTTLGGGFAEDRGWILNTRNGEVLPLGCLLSISRTVTSLTREELTSIKKRYIENKGPERLIMLHPFSVNWRISTNSVEKAFAVMRETEVKMKDFFDVEGNVRKRDLEFNDVLNLLKV